VLSLYQGSICRSVRIPDIRLTVAVNLTSPLHLSFHPMTECLCRTLTASGRLVLTLNLPDLNLLFADNVSPFVKAEGLYAIKAYEPPQGTDKIMRLHAQTAIFENGRVLLPRHAPWLADYITELTSFPGSRHDDQVDSTTQALDYLWEPDVIERWKRAFG
jgi:hypothetical protein